ncbi:type II toxin-antitoxin system PemK/MazF family toxin [Nocardia sp. NPDC020380]|uniref:type II toxin-antitoxin system PemK/MazF family toxin n=1 Tax=Nocardia sp. NPDC020380 TaxID=3364309 RepID=UPI0037AC4DE1
MRGDMLRGGVYRIDLGDSKRGHEQRGRRLGIVLSQTNWTMVTVVPTSTSAQPSRFRPTANIDGRETRLLVDQMRSIDSDYLHDMVGYLTREEMDSLETAIREYLDL